MKHAGSTPQRRGVEGIRKGHVASARPRARGLDATGSANTALQNHRTQEPRGGLQELGSGLPACNLYYRHQCNKHSINSMCVQPVCHSFLYRVGSLKSC